MNTKKIYISGMHCVSCERLLEDELGNISGVAKVRADRKNNFVEIDYENAAPDFSEIKKIAEKFGYSASLEKPNFAKNKKTNWKEWIYAIGIVLFFFFAYKLFLLLGIISAINVQSSKLTFSLAFLIGIVASLSSCLAVVGSVVLAFSEKYQAKNEGSDFKSALKPNLLFHFGRLSAFFLLGGLLGLVGGQISISGQYVSVLTIFVGVIMLFLGLNILGWAAVPISLPKKLTANFGKLKNSTNSSAPIVLGALTFFLPCGFTQSMQIFALASGSFWLGGTMLFLFALGTAPVLLTVGVATSFAKNNKLKVFQKVAGMLVVVFSVYTLSSGWALWGVSANVISTSDNATSAATKEIAPADNNSGAAQVIEMHVTSDGFEPGVFTIKKGQKVRWIIDGDQITSCTNKIIVPSLNITKSLTSGKNIVEFTPTKSGEIPFNCWMGMVRGKFIVN